MLETVMPSAIAQLDSFAPPILSDDTTASPNMPGPLLTIPPVPSVDDLKSPVKHQIEEVPAMAPQLNLHTTHIQSSPYADPLNHLNLRELSQPLRLFALTLTQFQATRPNYATSEYMSSFDWSGMFETLRELCACSEIQWKRQEFYVVIFRSKLREEADRAKLGELDQMSHQEACASGGLLHYWFGSPDAERRNLATCE